MLVSLVDNEGGTAATVKIFTRCRDHWILDPIYEEYSRGVSIQFLFAEHIQRIGDRTT